MGGIGILIIIVGIFAALSFISLFIFDRSPLGWIITGLVFAGYCAGALIFGLRPYLDEHLAISPLGIAAVWLTVAAAGFLNLYKALLGLVRWFRGEPLVTPLGRGERIMTGIIVASICAILAVHGASRLEHDLARDPWSAAVPWLLITVFGLWGALGAFNAWRSGSSDADEPNAD
jgi:hypothetical protein